MTSPTEWIAALTVGTVESVSPDEIRVILDVEAPQTVSLNSGAPAPFPRVNGYILIPNESGSVVGLVVFLGVERSPFPRRTGLKDFGLIDLPFPLRTLHVSPLGMLHLRGGSLPDTPHRYTLERGIAAFPSVGDPVLLPTPEQLRAIVEAEGTDRRVCIGASPLAANAQVFVDPDKLFGRHLAILGNTGSGKSCSVAGIIRWSLDAAHEVARIDDQDRPVNARFIVLDPNGEYLQTFSDFKPRIFKVPPVEGGVFPLRVPAWMWNSLEWSAFAQASPRVQRPLLLEALRASRSGVRLETSIEHRLARVFGGRLAHLRSIIGQGAAAYSRYQELSSLRHVFDRIIDDVEKYSGDTPSSFGDLLEAVSAAVGEVITQRGWGPTNVGKTGFNALAEADLESVAQALDALMSSLPTEAMTITQGEDSPIPFDLKTFPDFLGSLGALEVSGNEQYTANLIWRIRSLLSDGRLREIIGNEPHVNLADWLSQLAGTDGATGPISIIDLSLVPTEIIHLVIAVVARVVFEAVQRYRRLHGVELPTVLVLEEAHTFIHRSRMRDDDESEILTPAQMCRMTFERVAREGRKFGLGLLLASQRPYELSATVLAQCNTFLLHRLVNDQDQELVARLVPDNIRGILRELPSLPAGQAILLGWAAAVPVLVQMIHLPKHHRPHSNDPDYWKVWVHEEERRVAWKEITDSWTS